MAEWENSWPEAEAALREAARVHAAALSREKDVMRQATRRAHASEKALRALPAALERALAAESALKQLQEQKGLPTRTAIVHHEEASVSEQAAAAAAAEAAEAAAAGAEEESEAFRAMLRAEIDNLEGECAAREAAHKLEVEELQQRWRDSDAAHKARQAELEAELAALKGEGIAARAAADECEADLREQLGRAHAAGAESEALLQEERKVGQQAAEEASEREAELTIAWREEVGELRSQLGQMTERAEAAHKLLCEQVGRELETLGGLATKLYRPMEIGGGFEGRHALLEETVTGDA